MSTTLIIVLAAAIALAAIFFWNYTRQQRTKKLRSRFGPEYETAVNEYGDRTRAEQDLEKRTERRERYQIHPLTEEQRNYFGSEWMSTQAYFVENPPEAIHRADQLICETMKAKGYPMADFERRAEDLSVDYPHVVRSYRAARELASRVEEGSASTEDLRQAMVYYRELFDEMLDLHPARR